MAGRQQAEGRDPADRRGLHPHRGRAHVLGPGGARTRTSIILRTFSKIYGMAGICAPAPRSAARTCSQKIGSYSAGALPITGMAAASASLKSKNAGSRAPQDHRRRPRRRASLPGQAQLQLRAVRVQQVHGGREAARQCRSSRPCARRRSTSAASGRAGPPTSASPSARRTRWTSSRPRS